MSVIRNLKFTIHNSQLAIYVLRFTFWLILAAAVGGFYLLAARLAGYAGFPLDDAWIHQTYARNLAESGQLAFTPGVPSAGSTAPLWSLLLSVGYLLGAPFKAWAYGWGILFLGLTGFSLSRLAGRLFPRQRGIGLWVGLFGVLEWHLVWAAVSGMETMLFVWLSVLLVEQYAAGWPSVSGRRAFGLGLLGGLLVLTRPEGIGLVGLVGLDMARRWWGQQPNRSGAGWLLARWGAVVIGVALPLLPYVLFHLSLTGLPFPNTLYAKQAEYGVVLSSYPLWWRLFGNFGPTEETVQGVFRVIFIGPQVLLLPGLAWAGWLSVKERRVELWFIWVWWLSFLLLYGLRLAVTYQHGRYQIPAIVWVLLLGVWGTTRLLGLMRRRAWRVVGRAWELSLGLLLLAFVLIGARAYARDVQFIERQMVATARWLEANAAAEARLAAHDIGAIGYFTRRPLLDLAGLVTPEVIPFIRDEAALFAFVQAQQADYLVTFPEWYPQMVQQPVLEPVFAAEGPPGSAMTVYRLAPAP